MSDKIREGLIQTLPDRLKALARELSPIEVNFDETPHGLYLTVDGLVLRFQIRHDVKVVIYSYAEPNTTAVCQELTNDLLGGGLRELVLHQLRLHFGMLKPRSLG